MIDYHAKSLSESVILLNRLKLKCHNCFVKGMMHSCHFTSRDNVIMYLLQIVKYAIIFKCLPISINIHPLSVFPKAPFSSSDVLSSLWKSLLSSLFTFLHLHVSEICRAAVQEPSLLFFAFLSFISNFTTHCILTLETYSIHY